MKEDLQYLQLVTNAFSIIKPKHAIIHESIPSINSSLMKSARNFDSMNFCVSFIDNGIIRSDMNKEWVPGIKLQHFLILTKTNEKSYIFNCIGSKKNAYSIFCPIV